MSNINSTNQRKYLITIDTHIKPWYISFSQMTQIVQLVDWVNIMGYEFGNNNQKYTQFDSNLWGDFANDKGDNYRKNLYIDSGVQVFILLY